MLLFACAVLLFVWHGLAQEAAEDRGYTIAYNGSLHGSYVSGKLEMKSCGSGGAYYFSGLTDTIFKIGPPPDGEANPFYFRLNHAGREYRTTPAPNAAIGRSPANLKTALLRRYSSHFYLGGYTDDALYNLQVVSSWFHYTTGPPDDFISMNKSTLFVVDGGPGLGDESELPYYSLVGGIDSLNPLSAWEGFNFQIPQNYSYDEREEDSKCQTLSEPLFDWGELKNLTYELKFTNNSAEAMFSATTNESTVVTFYFSGARTDALHGDEWDFEANSTSPIALASPESHATPSFTFANGSKIPKQFTEEPNTPNTTQNSTEEDAATGQAVSYSWVATILVFALFMVIF